MRQRDAERRARAFVATHYPSYARWHIDLCEEQLARTPRGSKAWSFGITPDQDDADYDPDRSLVGYVHADGAVEGMY